MVGTAAISPFSACLTGPEISSAAPQILVLGAQSLVEKWTVMHFYPLALVAVIDNGILWFLVHAIIGAAGLMILLRHWGFARSIAALAGFVFSLNVVLVAHPALAWLPATLWLTERALKNGGRDLVFAAAVLCIQTLAGSAEILIVTIVLLAVTALGAQAWHRLAAIAGFTVLLAATQIVPLADVPSPTFLNAATAAKN